MLAGGRIMVLFLYRAIEAGISKLMESWPELLARAPDRDTAIADPDLRHDLEQ